MSATWPRRRPAPSAAAAVLLVHALLGLGLMTTLRVWPDRGPPLPPGETVWLRLLPDLPPPSAQPREPLARAAQQPRAAPAATPLRAPQAISAPSVPATAPPIAPDLTPAPESAPAALPTLRLDLPRAASSAQRNPALDDPRSNTPARNLESRLARAIGGVGAQVEEERLADGSLRLRRGTSCVVVRPSRAAQLDPFNQSVSPNLRAVDGC